MSHTEHRFYYKNKQLRSHLILGVFYTVFGLSLLILKGYALYSLILIFGVLQLYRYAFSKYKGYISINSSSIQKHHMSTRKIDIKNLTGIRYYVGVLSLIADHKTIDINKEFLSESDFETLEKQVKSILAEQNINFTGLNSNQNESLTKR